MNLGWKRTESWIIPSVYEVASDVCGLNVCVWRCSTLCIYGAKAGICRRVVLDVVALASINYDGTVMLGWALEYPSSAKYDNR